MLGITDTSMTSNYRRFQRGRYKRPLPTVVQSESSKSNAPGGITKFFSVAANISQVLMVLIVGGGYYFTVLPVFEKQKLTEDLSRLEIEKSSWEGLLEAQKLELDRLSKKEALLVASVERLKTENDLAIQQRDEAEKSVEESVARVSAAQRTLRGAEEKYYELQRAKLLGELPISVSFIEAFNLKHVSFDRDNTTNLESELTESVVAPLDVAEKQVDQLSQTVSEAKNNLVKKTARRLMVEFEEGVSMRQASLMCVNPDPKVWKSAFEGSYPIPESEVDSCVAMQFSHQQVTEGWSDFEVKKLRKSEFWDKQMSAYTWNCRYWLEVGVERLFNERWSAALAPCRTRIMNVPSIVLSETADPDDTPAFSSVAPPTEAEIVSALREVISGWYSDHETSEE